MRKLRVIKDGDGHIIATAERSQEEDVLPEAILEKGHVQEDVDLSLGYFTDLTKEIQVVRDARGRLLATAEPGQEDGVAPEFVLEEGQELEALEAPFDFDLDLEEFYRTQSRAKE